MSRPSPGSAVGTRVLAELATVSPYFVVSTGDADARWRPVAQLYDDDAVLAGLVGRIAPRIGATETRVAASILSQGYAARLWSLTLGPAVRADVVVDLDELLWRDEDGSISLHLERPVARSGGFAGAAARVIDRHLVPLVAAVRRTTGLSEQVLWGNAASALLGAALVLDGAAAGPARELVAPLLTVGPLTGTMSGTISGSRRRSCCLFYRVPGGGYCADCVLSAPSS